MKSTFLTARTDSESDSNSYVDLRRCESRSPSWWLLPNLCSLDAPVVAVVWLHAFAAAFHSPVSPAIATVLFLSVWAIYIADRLIDVRRQSSWHLATARHRFVRRQQRYFSALLALILFVAASLTLLALPFDLLIAGLVLGSVVALYFTAFVRLFPCLKPLRAKEFACGLLFAVGTALGVSGVRQEILTHPGTILPAVAMFASLCVFNCLIISASERLHDGANDPAAASTWWTHLDRDLTLFGSVIFGVAITLSLLGLQPEFFYACIISSLALTLLHLFQRQLSASLLRVLVDFTLLSPLLFLL